jgi:hypothetical protein
LLGSAGLKYVDDQQASRRDRRSASENTVVPTWGMVLAPCGVFLVFLGLIRYEHRLSGGLGVFIFGLFVWAYGFTCFLAKLLENK